MESFNSIRDPFPGDSSDDGAPGSYNVEELDEALERQAAEDAQRELDEAFERARHNLNEDVQPDSITVLESGSAPRNKLPGETCTGPRSNPTRISGQTEGERARCSPLARSYSPGSRRHRARASRCSGDGRETRYWKKVMRGIGS